MRWLARALVAVLVLVAFGGFALFVAAWTLFRDEKAGLHRRHAL